jgi:hypothetical protein
MELRCGNSPQWFVLKAILNKRRFVNIEKGGYLRLAMKGEHTVNVSHKRFL